MSNSPPPLPSAAVTDLADFPGRLSPMLVKELRQGLRTNLFTIAFILLQAFMILCILIGAADPGSSEATGFFWFFVVVSLLVIQPLRGFNALSSEYTLNTMDLIQMTELNSWRITLGKWTALNAQSLLLAIGILPYLVMRYFLGGVNFVSDLGTLGLMLIGSLLASAVIIGCSAFKNYVLRVILLVGCFFGYIFLTAILFDFGTPSSSKITLTILFSIYGIFFFLSFGASRIGPMSENHATRKRLVAILFAAISLAFYSWNDEDAFLFSALILGLSVLDAITEPPPIPEAVLRPFAGNPIKRLFAHFFSPGWHTGIWYTGLVFLLWSGAVLLLQELNLTGYGLGEGCLIVLCCGAMITFPLIIIHLFLKKVTNTQMHFGSYAFIQAAVALLTMLIFAVASSASGISEILYMVGLLPSVTLLGLNDGDIDANWYFILAMAAILVISLLIPLFRAFPLYKEMKEAYREIRKS